jgi:4-hydroxy-3-polyprenylbenzoate decarboxylase
MFPTLRDFIEALDKAGELQRVQVPVSPLLEITQITDKVSKSPAAHPSAYAAAFDPRNCALGGKGLLFESVQGSQFPLAINIFGSYHRMEMALGCHEQGPRPGGFEALAAQIAHLTRPEPPVTLWDKIKMLPQLAKIASYGPRVISNGLCQEVVKTGSQINLAELPIIKCWPLDGQPEKVGWRGGGAGVDARAPGRFITFGGMYTIHPDDAGKPPGAPRPSRNIGMYRAQVLDGTHTAMHWHMHHDGARHWRAWKKLGKPMPLAMVFGGESVLPYAATAPMPPGMSELLLAGFLNDAGIELVACKTIDMHVPANAEFVIEGLVSTEAGFPGLTAAQLSQGGNPGAGAVLEGPFGDHTGFYSLPDRYPIFTVTAITHRQNPIFPATIVGLPPQEDYYMGKATERLFLPLLQTLVPDIIDYHLPLFGCFHNCAFVKIRKEYPLQARRVMHAIWGAGQMSWTKFIIVVDERVNVHNEDEVLFHLCANCDPGRDVEVVNGPLDILDHAAPRLGAGHKMGFDATRKMAGEEVGGHAIRDYPPLIEMDEATKALVEKRWKEYGF